MKKIYFIIAISTLMIGCASLNYTNVSKVEPNKKAVVSNKKGCDIYDKKYWGEKIAKANYGDTLLVTGKYNWGLNYRVEYNDLIGFIYSVDVNLLKKIKPIDKTIISTKTSQFYQDKTLEPERKKSEMAEVGIIHTAYYWVKAKNLNVRSKPSLNSDVINVVPKGTLLHGIRKKGKWIKDEITGGWLHSDYLSNEYVAPEYVAPTTKPSKILGMTVEEITKSMGAIMEYSPLADGTPRYLGQTPTNCNIECIGSRTNINTASLMVPLSPQETQVAYNALTIELFLENTVGNRAITWFKNVGYSLADELEYKDNVSATKWFGSKKVKITAFSFGIMLITVTF